MKNLSESLFHLIYSKFIYLHPYLLARRSHLCANEFIKKFISVKIIVITSSIVREDLSEISLIKIFIQSE